MNYPLVGAFVLGLVAVLIAGALWLASGGAWQKTYDYFLAIEDESVAGLNVNAPVKYNGVDVGRVRQIQLDPLHPERVVLTFAIERGTPIKVDTVAVLKTQGLTGIAYVELAGGAPGSPLLRASVPGEYPVIRTKPSLSARLENVLTTVLTKLDGTSNNINALLSDANRQAVSSALADIAKVAHTLSQRQDTIDAALLNAGRTFENTARVTAQMGPAIERISRSAAALELMAKQTGAASTTVGQTVGTVGADLSRFTSELAPELQSLMGELNVLSASLRRLSEQTERNPSGLLFGRRPVPDGPGETAMPRAPAP